MIEFPSGVQSILRPICWSSQAEHSCEMEVLRPLAEPGEPVDVLGSLLHPRGWDKMPAVKACLTWGWAAGRVGCSRPSHGPAPLWVLSPLTACPQSGSL